jgi:hypothetical protein
MKRNVAAFAAGALSVLAVLGVGCGGGDAKDAPAEAASSSALAENDALIVRASAITPHGRLVVSPAVGFEDASDDGDTKAFCFAGAIASVCDRVVASGVSLTSCEADPAADRVTAHYVLAGRSVVRSISRCGGQAPAGGGTFLIGATAERSAHGVDVSVALGFRDRPAGAVRSFCYVGHADDVCALVARDGASDPTFSLADCSVDDDSVTATYADGADVIARCDR